MKAKIAKISEVNSAIAEGRSEADDTLIATSIQYSPKFDIYFLGLGDGTRMILPREYLRGRQHASPAQLKRDWPGLAVDLYVPALANGIHGSRGWMKGGRPRKQA